MIVIGALQQTAEERLDTDDLEVLSAHCASPDGPGDTVGFQTKILKFLSGYSRKHRIVITPVAHFRI